MDIKHPLLDKHFAKFVIAREVFNGDEKERFKGIIQRLTSSLEKGSSCISLSESEIELVAESNAVTVVNEIEGLPKTPLVLFEDKLYLQRYYFYESRLALQLKACSKQSKTLSASGELLNSIFSEETDEGEENFQRLAAEKALKESFLIISGGPGTGKTTTVVRVIGLLYHCIKNKLKVGLCAPTGKAAQRLYESILNGIPFLPPELQKEAQDWLPDSAVTLHRLLGYKRNSTQFKHNSTNPLSHDLVIVDEASMVDLALMSKLVDSLQPGSRLILLGDKDQLASVESGTVLSAALQGLPECSVELQKTYRFEGRIKELAEAVKTGDSEKFISVAKPCVKNENWQIELKTQFVSYIDVAQKTSCRDIVKLFQLLKSYMVLCGTRKGPRGVQGINQMIESHLHLEGFSGLKETWYPGRPILVSRNDYNLGLYNGDIGICLADETGTLKVWFEDGDKFKQYPTAALHNCETVYAMTIHKSQGSEFSKVVLVLPEVDSRVLCRELIYTGITRAKKEVQIVAEEEVLVSAIARMSERGTGLTEMLLSKKTVSL